MAMRRSSRSRRHVDMPSRSTRRRRSSTPWVSRRRKRAMYCQRAVRLEDEVQRALQHCVVALGFLRAMRRERPARRLPGGTPAGTGAARERAAAGGAWASSSSAWRLPASALPHRPTPRRARAGLPSCPPRSTRLLRRRPACWPAVHRRRTRPCRSSPERPRRLPAALLLRSARRPREATQRRPAVPKRAAVAPGSVCPARAVRVRPAAGGLRSSQPLGAWSQARSWENRGGGEPAAGNRVGQDDSVVGEHGLDHRVPVTTTQTVYWT